MTTQNEYEKVFLGILLAFLIFALLNWVSDHSSSGMINGQDNYSTSISAF